MLIRAGGVQLETVPEEADSVGGGVAGHLLLQLLANRVSWRTPRAVRDAQPGSTRFRGDDDWSMSVKGARCFKDETVVPKEASNVTIHHTPRRTCSPCATFPIFYGMTFAAFILANAVRWPWTV
ncbi:hypothetical protein CLCR_09284 [Cladophialophora carrionii]|uniref:Uncharacterized protein n=1 Tax=Cladophialophora carrionii TaxID=86049 RepID=A0A1C1CTU4_9EURO|nr:hypothetical protein CLCR_09284 [Cladophialophora carrionii]